MLSPSSVTVIGSSSSYVVDSSSLVKSPMSTGSVDPRANSPRSVRVKPKPILPTPATSMSPFSSRVTDSGTATCASRWTSG
jgi:hypothetical protein